MLDSCNILHEWGFLKDFQGLVHFPGQEKIAPALLAVSDIGHEIKAIATRVSHPCWVLDYARTDLGAYRVGSSKGAWKPRKALTAHLYPPHTVYWEELRNIRKAGHALWITFSGGDAAGLGKLAKPHSCAEFEDNGRLLAGTMERIAEASIQNDFWKAQSLFCEIIRLLLNGRPLGSQRYSVEGEKEVLDTSPLYRTVRDYLEKHLGERIRLKDLAREAGVSLSLLCHRYREEIGEAPMETLMAMRMNRVKALLLKGERLKNIAEATGFTDEFHLSKMFKRKEGVSPREFIRSLAT